MILLDILAVLLTLSALFGSLNETQLRLPYTVGLVAIALVASLAVVLAQTQSHTDARRPPCSCGRWWKVFGCSEDCAWPSRVRADTERKTFRLGNGPGSK